MNSLRAPLAMAIAALLATPLQAQNLPAPPEDTVFSAQWEVPSPGKAKNLSPKGKITTAKPSYRWVKGENATHYYLHVYSETPDTGISAWYTAKQTGCGVDSEPDTVCLTTPQTRLKNGTYRWQVLSWNAGGFGPWSAPQRFTVTADETKAINDTGITDCADEVRNGLRCPVTGYPQQDAESGRDTTHNTDRDGYAGFDFVKLDSAGWALPHGAKDWACVRDRVTGLVWENKTDGSNLRNGGWTYSWYKPDVQGSGNCFEDGRCDTAKYVQDVNQTNLCGFADWRLPSAQELIGIVDYSVTAPNPTVDTYYFPVPTTGESFWTNIGTQVSFVNGGSDYSPEPQHVRLVRGEQSISLVDRADGTVEMLGTGLIWAKCAQGLSGANCTGKATEMSWHQALLTANRSNVGGYGDWRLPNIKELQTLGHYYDPNVMSAPNGYYWSSSPTARSLNEAWQADLYNGNSTPSTSDKYGYGYVRLVRVKSNSLGKAP